MATLELPTLREGDSGDAVRFLEQLLSAIYWFGQKPGKPALVKTNIAFTAKYDSQCKQIITEFQKNYNVTFPFPAPDIKVDGITTPETWKALGDAIFKYSY